MNATNHVNARRGNKSAGGAGAAAGAAADAGKQAVQADGKTAAQADGAQGEGFSEAQMQSLIGKALKDTFDKELPTHLKSMLTEDGVKGIIAAEFKKLSKDSTTISQADINTLLANSVKAQMDTMRKDKKFVQDPDDANGSKGASDDGSSDGKSVRVAGERIELGRESWTKGNLPLHGKQLLNIMMKRPPNEGVDEKQLTRGIRLGDTELGSLQNSAKTLQKYSGKALTSTTGGSGDELVPTDLSAQLLRRFFLASNLAAVFMADEVAMPTDPYVYPLATVRPTYLVEPTENTAFTPSDPTTANTTLTTKRFVGEVDFSDEIDEDSIIAILPMVEQLLAEGAADAWEDALINGDTTGTHQDTDTAAGSAKLPAKHIKGFRKLALAASLKTDLSSGGFATFANFLAARLLLGKYGGDPRNLIWVVNPTTAIRMQGITEAATLEKFGSRATIITGEIAALQGIPIIQSERVRADVDATGVNGASGNTKSTILCINRKQFMTGFRRQFRVETDKLITSGKNMVVASFRKAFSPIEVPSATVSSVAIGYNAAA